MSTFYFTYLRTQILYLHLHYSIKKCPVMSSYYVKLNNYIKILGKIIGSKFFEFYHTQNIILMLVE